MAENNKSRGSNFTGTELNQLCASWMHVSQDPIVGSAQKMGAFWDRIVKHYNDFRPKDRERRNVRSLETKWSELKRDVAKFSGCYATVVNANHSSDNEEDTIRKAKELYVTKDSKGKEFQYLDQWSFLKDCPRFAMCMDDMKQKAAQKSAKKRKGKGRNNSEKENESPNVEAVIDRDLSPDEGDDQQRQSVAHSVEVDDRSRHAGERRPVGNKTAKRLRSEESSVRVMACAHREMVEISAKRLRLAESQDRQHLFMMRVADLDPECQEFFHLCRAKELRIAMAKLHREEEEELLAHRNVANRTPLLEEPVLNHRHSDCAVERHIPISREVVQAPMNFEAQIPNEIATNISFEAELEMAELDRDLVD